jgi:hypothetical protein
VKKTLKENIPRFHSESELKGKIEYIKWLILLSTVGLSASVALFKYFVVTNDVLIWFYEFGWLCLVLSIWIGIQIVYMMTATKVFQIGSRKKEKLVAVVHSGLNKKWRGFVNDFFRVISAQFEMVAYLFMAGFASLIIAIFFPLIADNPIKSLTMIPALSFIIWSAIPTNKKA